MLRIRVGVRVSKMLGSIYNPGHSMSNHQIFGHISTDLLRFFLKFGTLVGIV